MQRDNRRLFLQQSLHPLFHDDLIISDSSFDRDWDEAAPERTLYAGPEPIRNPGFLNKARINV